MTADPIVRGEELVIPHELGTMYELVAEMDEEVLAVVQRRTDLARQIAAQQRANIGYSARNREELAVIHRFDELGRAGHDLGRLLIQLGQH